MQVLSNQSEQQQLSHQLSNRNEHTPTETTTVQTEKYQRIEYLTIHQSSIAPNAENTLLLKRQFYRLGGGGGGGGWLNISKSQLI